ncbi:MAG TPA: anion permease [Candidatus Scatomorpha pullistercoris]|uniref:Anion permease n=1 Tax=Candidatus Scatomorpha pullistercoris TaxID=2840929 RepID=A0A9D1G3L5_9FIRM|nr:anion permease [Candidatus Scatomorpha pullistercoris]
MSKQNIKRIIFFVIAVAVGIAIGSITPPEGLTVESMKFAGIFAAVLILLISQQFVDWTVMLAAMCLLPILKITTFAGAFSAWSGSTLWLVIMVFALSVGIANSGLLTRIALKMLSLFPATYKGAVTALMATSVVLGPLVPSLSAKVNLLVPLATETTAQLGLKERSKGALGLFSATYITAQIGGNAFITGSAHVALMLSLISDNTWDVLSWLKATALWLVVIVVGTYIFSAMVCKPKEKVEFPPSFFKDKAKALGPITTKEKIAITLLVFCIVLWSTTSLHGLDTTTTGLIIVALMFYLGLFSTMDLITKVPWSMMVQIGGLLGLSGCITSLGWSTYIANLLAPVFSPLVANPVLFVAFLCVSTYIMRFVLIDQMACTVVYVAIFAPIIASCGIAQFIVVFCVFMAGMVWNTSYQNPLINVTIQIAGGKYVPFSEARKASWAFMVIFLAACLASVPVWTAFGLM